MDFKGNAALEAVLTSFDTAADPRTREILRAVTTHLHALVNELQPTQSEWEQAIDFLTAVGEKCDPTRQEFVLLSDVFGVSTLVETLNEHDHGTQGTVLGPFHMTESPRRALGESIDLVGAGTPCLVTGTVTDIQGSPLSGAIIDIWQCNAEGFYDVQQPDMQPAGNGRGVFSADQDGRFWFRSVVPSHYPIPTDGPVGELLAAAGRHPYRPAHVHVIADAPGYNSLTTHLFVADSCYLDSDAVFAVKQSLIVDFVESTDADAAAQYGLPIPFRHAHFDIRLTRGKAGHA